MIDCVVGAPYHLICATGALDSFLSDNFETMRNKEETRWKIIGGQGRRRCPIVRSNAWI